METKKLDGYYVTKSQFVTDWLGMCPSVGNRDQCWHCEAIRSTAQSLSTGYQFYTT